MTLSKVLSIQLINCSSYKLDVVSVKITNKTGGNYSDVNFDTSVNYSPDGTHVICPKNAIFEIKFPNTDIKGKIT